MHNMRKSILNYILLNCKAEIYRSYRMHTNDCMLE